MFKPPFSMPAGLRFDENVGFWTSHSGDRIDYTEGNHIEELLLRILEESDDNSAFAPSLVPQGSGWEITYHLHPDRGNLVAGFQFSTGCDVLEVGAGCGAVTRALGEATSGSVIALEGAPGRARICAARTADLDHVEVVAAPLGAVDFGPIFDVVVVVGVLEYAARFLSVAEDPHDEFLRRCRSQLAPGGTMILAIENQLGAKYLAGAREDHTGRRFDGVEGYPGQRSGPRTFGREELRSLVERRFASAEFVLAYPDYKMPKLLLAESFSDSHDVSELIDHTLSGGLADTIFSESLLTRTLALNGLTSRTANSFVVLARTEEARTTVSLPNSGVLFGNRVADRPTRITRFECSGGHLESVKSSIGAERWPPSSRIEWAATRDRWIDGRSIASMILDALRSGASVEECAEIASPWRRLLTAAADGEDMLPGTHLDATWSNCMWTEDRIGSFIDLEWRSCELVHASVPLFRSIATTLDSARKAGIDSQIVRRPIREIRSEFASEFGIQINPRHHEEYRDLSAELSHYAYGIERRMTRRKLALQEYGGRAWAAYENSSISRSRWRRQVTRARRKVSIELRRRTRS